MIVRTFVATAALLVAVSCVEAADDKPKDDINNYLVSITGGAVSASNLVGVDKSGITQIETSQDLIVALQPFTSGEQKSGFGLAITPARTSLFPMSGATYVGNRLAPLLGSLTLSYAQNSEDINDISHKKTGYSVDTVYYFDIEQDPIKIGSKAFAACSKKDEEQIAKDIDTIVRNAELSRDAKQAALQALTDKRDASVSSCIDAVMKEKVRWNSGRLSISYGEARIKAPGGDSNSLGKSFTLNAQFPAGDRAVTALSLRRIRDALDVQSLGGTSLSFNSSSLAAVRFTYGDQEGTHLRALIEASNAKSSSAAAFKDSFMYALGIDKKVSKGAWLEFRLGRNRSRENGKEQTTGLMTLSISPTLFDFRK